MKHWTRSSGTERSGVLFESGRPGTGAEASHVERAVDSFGESDGGLATPSRRIILKQ